MRVGTGWWFRLRLWLHEQRANPSSERERLLLVVLAVLASLFLGGTFMGLSSLESVWALNGRYISLCEDVVVSEEPVIQVLPDAVCRKQASKLGAISHVATGATFAAISNAGLLTDWLGARRIYGAAISLLILGNFMAIVPGYWTQFIGTTLMSAAGPCVAFTLLIWAQLLPHATHWIVALTTAAFPGGAYMLALLRLAILQRSLSISGFYAIWLFASIPAFYLFIIWPKGIGKPYAAAHPLRMLAQIEFLKKLMERLHITIPDDTDNITMIELEDRYIKKDITTQKKEQMQQEEPEKEEQIRLNFDALPTPSEQRKLPIHPSKRQDINMVNGINGHSVLENSNETQDDDNKEMTIVSESEPSVALDEENNISDVGQELRLKDLKWVSQLMAPSIALIQIYFLLVSVWLAVVANQGSSRLVYWAQKIGDDQDSIDSMVADIKSFLPSVDFINAVSILVSPLSALVLRTVGITGLSLITQVIVTVSALLCLLPSISAQFLNYYLFAVVRGFMYPFAMMFLIQVCGRRHLGLLWGMTVGGAGPTEIIGTALNKYWLYRPNAWNILNGVQLIPPLIAWILPIYIWLRQEKLEHPHPEPLQ